MLALRVSFKLTGKLRKRHFYLTILRLLSSEEPQVIPWQLPLVSKEEVPLSVLKLISPLRYLDSQREGMGQGDSCPCLSYHLGAQEKATVLV